MNYLAKLLLLPTTVQLRTKHHYNKYLFKSLRTASLSHLVIGHSNCFNSPTTAALGKGLLQIEHSNVFGAPMAPCIGNGMITLQPRTLEARIHIGSHNWLSNNITIIANQFVSIGNYCLIGDMVSIFDSDFHAIAPSRRRLDTGPSIPVKISDNVWIGSRSLILKGVEIGENSIVAAGSIVTNSIPANTIVAGIPAKAIRQIL